MALDNAGLVGVDLGTVDHPVDALNQTEPTTSPPQSNGDVVLESGVHPESADDLSAKHSADSQPSTGSPLSANFFVSWSAVLAILALVMAACLGGFSVWTVLAYDPKDIALFLSFLLFPIKLAGLLGLSLGFSLASRYVLRLVKGAGGIVISAMWFIAYAIRWAALHTLSAIQIALRLVLFVVVKLQDRLSTPAHPDVYVFDTTHHFTPSSPRFKLEAFSFLHDRTRFGKDASQQFSIVSYYAIMILFLPHADQNQEVNMYRADQNVGEEEVYRPIRVQLALNLQLRKYRLPSHDTDLVTAAWKARGRSLTQKLLLGERLRDFVGEVFPAIELMHPENDETPNHTRALPLKRLAKHSPTCSHNHIHIVFDSEIIASKSLYGNLDPSRVFQELRSGLKMHSPKPFKALYSPTKGCGLQGHVYIRAFLDTGETIPRCKTSTRYRTVRQTVVIIIHTSHKPPELFLTNYCDPTHSAIRLDWHDILRRTHYGEHLGQSAIGGRRILCEKRFYFNRYSHVIRVSPRYKRSPTSSIPLLLQTIVVPNPLPFYACNHTHVPPPRHQSTMNPIERDARSRQEPRRHPDSPWGPLAHSTRQAASSTVLVKRCPPHIVFDVDRKEVEGIDGSLTRASWLLRERIPYALFLQSLPRNAVGHDLPADLNRITFEAISVRWAAFMLGYTDGTLAKQVPQTPMLGTAHSVSSNNVSNSEIAGRSFKASDDKVPLISVITANNPSQTPRRHFLVSQEVSIHTPRPGSNFSSGPDMMIDAYATAKGLIFGTKCSFTNDRVVLIDDGEACSLCSSQHMFQDASSSSSEFEEQPVRIWVGGVVLSNDRSWLHLALGASAAIEPNQPDPQGPC
ncbi:hypothetical protein NMY22_g14457 [Coprinellus aureogranulatus]|nr:hypothetical protein NMY22_g14457 [Coprinellus aureogranulatus]